jgi:hypothetical protein
MSDAAAVSNVGQAESRWQSIFPSRIGVDSSAGVGQIA